MYDLENGQKSLTPCRDVVNMLQWACVRSLVVPLIPMTWKWIIRKNHHVGPSKCSKGGHHCRDFCLHFLRLSGSMNRVEECMGQDPRILLGRILARLRIKGMRRPGGRNRGSSCLILLALLAPLELVFVPVSLLRLAYLMLLELLASSRDCTLTFGRGDVQHLTLGTGVEFLDMLFAVSSSVHAEWRRWNH
ncbi:hypothetical protein HID58_061893 [Brassica napus]|uniref:Uncharacterized protein n=1 Tax=Brassica napus TaxID=3708 RepID=A0ABQ7ZZX4_BRANA|nr:hypothetical protein HID58_061893 [Brassica napus]